MTVPCPICGRPASVLFTKLYPASDRTPTVYACQNVTCELVDFSLED